MSHPMSRRARVASLLSLSIAAITSGCIDPGPEPYVPETVDRSVLVHFQTCDSMLDYVKYRALEQVGPYGLDGGDWGWGAQEGDFGADGGGPVGGTDNGGVPLPPSDGSGGDDGTTPDYSGTNVQEAGVDEPDIVKTDGTRILALAQGALHYVDVAGEAPVLTSSLTVLQADQEYYWYDGAEMIVRGDRVMVVVRRNAWDLPASIKQALDLPEDDWQSIVQLVEIDISDPSAMQLVSSLYVEGNYVSGRLVDDTARIVVDTPPAGLRFHYPDEFIDDSAFVETDWNTGWDELAWMKASSKAEAANREVINNSEAEDWIPSYVLESHGPGGTTLDSGLLIECQRMMRPGTHAGLGTVSVLTVDMANPLALGDAVGVLSQGQTVYATPDSLYVATRPMVQDDQGPEMFEIDGELHFASYVHKFDISSTDAAHYLASGQVPGFLLDQWAMSEHEGDLRVASTEWGWSELSESYVTVLRQRGDVLETVGQVDGLGQGEQIYAVRFIDDVGYVVTFRQIDPLYTIDLADPTAPTVVGELKIEGYSAYLHPVGEGLLLGVGRDGTEDGQVLGSQLSLFDVSDPANPVAIHQAAFGEWGSSEVEFDHRAFLWWAPENLAVFPVQSWGFDEQTGQETNFNGALAYRVDPESGITLVGTLVHEQDGGELGWYGNGIRRSLVIGDQLYTMSDTGLLRSGLQDMAGSGWVAF